MNLRDRMSVYYPSVHDDGTSRVRSFFDRHFSRSPGATAPGRRRSSQG